MAPVTTTASTPSYDMVLQIMECVRDVVTLFRCATACKGWRDLLAADPSFLRRCLLEDVCRRSAPLPGFFAQLRPRRGSPTPCLVPAPRPVLGSHRRPLKSFIPNLDDAGFFDHAVPLVSRHGLLLVRLDPMRDGLLAVCNLLTGSTLDVLPRLEHDCAVEDEDLTGYAILTAADCSSTSKLDDHHEHWLPFFKVLVIRIIGSTMQYRLRTFSSAGEPRWSICSGALVGGRRVCTEFMQPNAVVCRGTARWLLYKPCTYFPMREGSGFYTLDVSAKSSDVFFTKLALTRDLVHDFVHYGPAELEESYFSVGTEGRFALIWLQSGGLQLMIWTWDDNGNFPDARALMLKLPYRQKKKEIGDVVYTCFGENGGTLLIKDNHRRVYLADVKTGLMREVTGDWPNRCNLRRCKTVALEMDWPALLLSRLGVAT